MIRKIGFRIAVRTMMTLLTGIIIYHLLIISGIISYEATWGGRLETKAQMYRFEGISIGMNLFLLLIVAIKGKYINAIRPGKLINILLGVFAVLFAFNTIGNILSNNIWEAIIFTPLTLVFSILCYRMTIER